MPWPWLMNQMRNEKKTNLLEVEPLGKVRVEKGRCFIVTMEDGHLSGCGRTLELAIAALRSNVAIGAVAAQRGRKEQPK